MIADSVHLEGDSVRQIRDVDFEREVMIAQGDLRPWPTSNIVRTRTWREVEWDYSDVLPALLAFHSYTERAERRYLHSIENDE